MAKPEILQKLVRPTEYLRATCADVGLLVCQSEIPIWLILDLHSKWDPLRFCNYMDETSKSLRNHTNINMVNFSLRLKEKVSAFPQFKNSLIAAAEETPHCQIICNKLELVDDSLISYILELIGLLKEFNLHDDMQIKNWIMDFQYKNSAFKEPGVPVTVPGTFITISVASDSSRAPGSKKTKRDGSFSSCSVWSS